MEPLSSMRDSREESVPDSSPLSALEEVGLREEWERRLELLVLPPSLVGVRGGAESAIATSRGSERFVFKQPNTNEDTSDIGIIVLLQWVNCTPQRTRKNEWILGYDLHPTPQRLESNFGDIYTINLDTSRLYSKNLNRAETRVDLPLPVAPTIPTLSPARIERLTPSSTSGKFQRRLDASL